MNTGEFREMFVEYLNEFAEEEGALDGLAQFLEYGWSNVSPESETMQCEFIGWLISCGASTAAIQAVLNIITKQ